MIRPFAIGRAGLVLALPGPSAAKGRPEAGARRPAGLEL